MVNRIQIKNYKSIKELKVEATRVNLFIGAHNSGKSNILEALSWFSTNALNDGVFSELFRYKNLGDFFFDFDGTQKIEVNTDELSLKIRYARNNLGALLNYFEGIIYETSRFMLDDKQWRDGVDGKFSFDLSIMDNKVVNPSGNLKTPFRTYHFKRLSKFNINYRPFLNPPFGENIPNLLQSNRIWKQRISDFFRSKGFRLIVKPIENEIEMAKEINDELYSFPYQIISETMQRFVFLMLALESNEDSILVLDEPESNMFPFFVKEFAERISDNTSNQFFIATHNPYLLGSLLEKTPLLDISVFITSMKNYETVVEKCTDEQIEELISFGSGSFFNLDNILR
jgi:AAA15 family ATPase/GTPase